MTCAPRLIKEKLGTYICASRSKGNYLSSTVSIVLSHYCDVELTSIPITVKTTVELCSVEMKLLSNYCTVW